jgi:aromatic-L-amino-acid/L-tryptophan decarboxylase
MTPEEFRRAGYALVDWIADHRARAPDRPVLAPVRPAELRGRLPATAPEHGESVEQVLADLDALIAPALTDWQHPRFFGYFPSNGLLAGVLGDLASTGLGVLGLSWQSGPAITELEEVVADWLRQLLGLPEAFQGVIQDTASTSTLVALICARERTSEYALARAGLQGERSALVVYASEHAHSSVDKATLLAGFGRDNLRRVPSDSDYAMDPAALRASIRADRAAGRRPCAIVATVGTTSTTAVDPIEEIAAIARDEHVWLHVDAAMGGSAMIVPECRALWSGIEGADSLVVNAHKWLGVPFDCSLYYVRDPEHLVRVMSTNPSYLQSAVDGQVRQYRDWGIPLGRRFRALKLWFVLREQGAEALRGRIRRDLSNARRLEAVVRAAPQWHVLAPVLLQTLCLRHEPPGLGPEALDQHTLAWVERLNRSGFAYLTPAQLGGRWMARFSIGALATEWPDIESTWREMERAVRA